jgi:hypothetical protein
MEDGGITYPENYYRNQITPERILCAAIWYKLEKEPTHTIRNINKGMVISGYRHCDIIDMYYMLTGKRSNNPYCVQGFLTSKKRFVDRVEANKIAIERGQVIGNELGDELISEDLY